MELHVLADGVETVKERVPSLLSGSLGSSANSGDGDQGCAMDLEVWIRLGGWLRPAAYQGPWHNCPPTTIVAEWWRVAELFHQCCLVVLSFL